MGYFNIDFSKFTPSSKQATPSATPTVSQKLNTNLEKIIPTTPPMSSPTPMSRVPTTPVTVTQPAVKETPKTGMGKLFNWLNKPSEWTQSLLTGGRTYEEAYGDPNSAFYKVNKAAVDLSPLNIIPGYKAKQEEKWNKAMENETAKKIGGSAWRFIADPLNFIPFGKIGGLIGKGASKVDDVLKLSKMGDKVMDWARETPAIYKTVEKTVNPFFRNPEFGKLMKQTEGVTGKRLNDLYDLIRKTAENLSPAQQKRIGQILEGGIDTSAKYDKLAAPLRKLTEEIGQEAVDLGILSRKSFEKYRGVYMKHIFDKYLDVTKGQGFTKRVAPGIGNQFNKVRKGAEGYVREFTAPTFLGLGSGIKDIEAAKFYKKIANDFGVGVDTIKKGRKIIDRVVPEGYEFAGKAITNSKVAKFFKNKALPSSIIDYINRTSDIKKVTGWDKMLNAWKAGKTIYNPAYHVRNVISNQILTDMSTGKGLINTVSDYVGAVKQYIGKGNQKFVDAAADLGIIKQKRFGAALDEFLDSAKVVEQSKFQKVADFPRKLQTVTEETAKLNVFKSWIEKLAKKAGSTIDDALKNPDILQKAASKAEEAIFSPYRINQFERAAIGQAIPFYSFTRQVIPFTIKTLMQNPARIAKYAKTKREIENFSKDEGRPSYAENYIRLPIKNEKGEPLYFDPTYIYPFGNVFEGGERGKLPFGLGFNPIFTEIAQQMANKDFYYDQPITPYESENLRSKNTQARVKHALRTAAPQFLSNVASKIIPAITGKPDYAGRQRNFVQSAIDTVGGIKTQYISPSKGILDKYYNLTNETRSKQNDIKKILNDNSLTDEEKRDLIEKVLK